MPELTTETTETEIKPEPKATTTLTEEQVNAALSQDDSVDDEAGQGEGDKPKHEFDFEKAQQQSRELGNLKREIASMAEQQKQLLEMLKKPPETKAEAVVQDKAEELFEEVKALQDEDVVEAKTLKQLFGKLGSLLKKSASGEDTATIKTKLAELTSQIDTANRLQKYESEFNAIYPALEGHYRRLDKWATQEAIKGLGQDADPKEISGLATWLLNQKSAKLSKMAATNGLDKVVVDKTNMVKPTQSTKGTAKPNKSGAAPRSESITREQVESDMAKMLQEDFMASNAD